MYVRDDVAALIEWNHVKEFNTRSVSLAFDVAELRSSVNLMSALYLFSLKSLKNAVNLMSANYFLLIQEFEKCMSRADNNGKKNELQL